MPLDPNDPQVEAALRQWALLTEDERALWIARLVLLCLRLTGAE